MPCKPWGIVMVLVCGLAGIICPADMTLAEAPVLASGAVVASGAESDYPPFSIVEKDGRATGFAVELMRAAVKAMGREATFRTGPWPEVRGWLERGEIEALPLVGRTPEREALFDFTVPYMTLHGVIVVRKGTKDIRDLNDLKGRQVAVMKGDNAEEFLRREERGLAIVTTDTFETALRELSGGRHDAVVIQRLVALRLIEGMGLANLEVLNRPVEGFRQDFCFAVREGDRETLALLNEGLAIATADGTYRHLHAKWFAALQLPTTRRLVIGGDDNFPPFEYRDENGRPAGFYVDLMRAVANEVGLDIDIRLTPWRQVLQHLESGETDAVQGMFFSSARELKFDFTQTHMVVHYVSVVQRGAGSPPDTFEALAGRRIVVQQDDIMHGFVVAHGLDRRMATVDAQEEALRAVVEGRNDVALVARLTALYWIEKNGWTNLVVGKTPVLSPEYGFATGRGQKALLAQLGEGLEILEKNGEYRRIRQKWMGVYREEAPTLLTALRTLALILGPFLLAFLVVVLWSWSLRRQVARKTRALKESIDKFRFVFEAANAGKSLTLPTGEINANQALADLLGYTLEELRGKTWQELTPVEEVAAIQRKIDPLLTGNEDVTRFEKGYLHKNGDVIWADVSTAIRRDAAGQPLHFVTTVIDITARQQAMERLLHLTKVLEANHRVNQIIRHAKDPIELLKHVCNVLTDTRGYHSAWICLRDPAGNIKAVAESGIGEAFAAIRATLERGEQPVCCQLDQDQSGISVISSKEVICEKCPSACYPSDTAALVGTLNRIDHDYGVIVVALPANLADEPEEQALFQELVDDIAFALQSIDIEQAREQAESALAASAEQYRLLADNTLDVIWTMNMELEFTYVNPAIEQLAGYTPEEWVGSHLLDHFDEAQISEIAANIEMGIARGRDQKGVAFETALRHRDGSIIHIELRGKVLVDAKGNPIRIQGVARDITERKQVEESLRKSENLFERIFDFLPIGLWIADKTGRLIRGNPAGVRIWGALPDVGMDEYGVFKARRLPSGKGIAPDDWALTHTIKDGVVITDELMEIDAFDGKKKSILNYTAPVLNDKGEIEAAVVANLDITDRIQAETERIRSEHRMRTLLDTLPDLVWLKDRDGVYLFCNSTFERFFGAKESDIVGKTDYDFVDRDLADFFREKDRQAMAAGGPSMNEERLTFADGGYQGDFETIKMPMMGANDDLIGVLGIAHDVSERKAAERALQQNARRYISAQHLGRVGNWEYDIATEVFWGSEEAGRIYGFDVQYGNVSIEELGRCIPERERAHQALVDLIAEGKPYDLEYEIHPQDGAPPRIIRSIAQLVRDSSGVAVKVEGVIQDITRQKKAEKERRRLEGYLQQAQKMESVGRLAGGVAHDFNNILSVILGYADLAVSDIPPGDPLHDDLREIIDAAQRSRGITRQLLAFARKEVIAPEVLDLNETVENMLKMLQRLIGEDIDLAWQPAPGLWPVKMDPSQIDQVMANLCVNARDAIDDVGKVTIVTSTVSLDEAYCDDHPGFVPGDFVVLAVSDNGSGMERETLDNVFEPFFTTKGIGRGTGMGLPMVYGIVKQNNGFINVYSEPGEGTRIQIYLPRHLGQAVEERRVVSETVHEGRGETVLLVEDDPAILKLTTRILKGLNYNVLTASNPKEALASSEAHTGHIHLLVTDVVMPDMNGRELSDRLTTLYPKLRTLFMSGYTADVIANRGVLDSGVHFLHKPFSRQALAAGVRAVLDDAEDFTRP